MRVAAIVLALILTVPFGLAACGVAVAGAFVQPAWQIRQAQFALMLALPLWVLGAAFAYGKPGLSLALFLTAALITGLYSVITGVDLAILAFGASLILSGLIYADRRKTRAPRARESAGEARAE